MKLLRWICLVPVQILVGGLVSLLTAGILASQSSLSAPVLLLDLVVQPMLIFASMVLTARVMAPDFKRLTGWISAGTLGFLFVVAGIFAPSEDFGPDIWVSIASAIVAMCLTARASFGPAAEDLPSFEALVEEAEENP